MRDKFRCLSWFTLNRAKLTASRAQFWVFALQGFKSEAPDFVVIPTLELQECIGEIHGSDGEKIQSYLCSTEKDQCWEIRGLRNSERLQIANGTYECPARDLTRYLNDRGWAVMAK